METIALNTAQTTTAQEVSAQANNQLFADLIEQYSDDMYRYAYWLSGSKEVAEDLVQETMLRAWKNIHKLNNPKAVKGWLITIVRRENARRFERIQPQMSEMPTEELASKHTDYDTSTEAFVLRQAISRSGTFSSFPQPSVVLTVIKPWRS